LTPQVPFDRRKRAGRETFDVGHAREECTHIDGKGEERTYDIWFWGIGRRIVFPYQKLP